MSMKLPLGFIAHRAAVPGASKTALAMTDYSPFPTLWFHAPARLTPKPPGASARGGRVPRVASVP